MPSAASTELNLLRACERHEAHAWAACVEACGRVDGDPMRAAVMAVRGTPVPMIAAADHRVFNRVIGLGCDEPADQRDIEEIVAIYNAAAQRNFTIEVSPVAQPGELAKWVTDVDLVAGPPMVKVWRVTSEPPIIDSTLRVERIGIDRAGAFFDVQYAAWENAEPTDGPWFTGSVGAPGFHHYIAYDGVVPVSTGTLYVTGRLGWLGFGATHPDHRRKGGQSLTMARRIADARDLGCSIVHTETNAPTPGQGSASHRTMTRLGFTTAYERAEFVSRS